MNWSGGYIEWIDGNTAYISVVFSWLLGKAFQRAIWLKMQGYEVRAGGPAVSYNPKFLSSVAEIGGEVDALSRHNPDATFTTRGCVRRCSFCIVPKIEPEYKELDDFPICPIVCDNNFLAASRKHFDKVIDRLKPLKDVDFNSGLDARILNKYQAERLAELNLYCIRPSWDHTGIEKDVMRSIDLILSAGIPKEKIRCYVLIGFDDTPEDALYRLQTLLDMGIWGFPMRYQPLNAIKRNEYISPAWTERKLRDYMRYWTHLRWLRGIPFDDYVYVKTDEKLVDNLERVC